MKSNYVKYYEKRKEQFRALAIQHQEVNSYRHMTWGEVADIGNYFERQARRFGLIKEFRENGII